jgi:hypothetical protein
VDTRSIRLRGAFALLVCAVLLFWSHGAVARPSVDELIERLKSGEDFRVRVQAALELGKSKNPAGRDALEGALDDDNAAVRTACAAALKVLADKRSISALEKHKGDSSQSVRTQIQATLKALKALGEAVTTKVLVKMGTMRSAKGNGEKKLLGDLESASRQKFGELPGVKLVEGNGDGASEKGKKVPMVMITGHLRKIRESTEGSEVVFSASVEYVVHKMPEQAIAGTVSGTASTKASKSEAKNKKRSRELQRMVLAAAIESAIRRAPEALAAATR